MYFTAFTAPATATPCADSPLRAAWGGTSFCLWPTTTRPRCWSRALAITPRTSLVTNYMFLTPFLALLLDYGVTGGLPDGATVAGGGIVLAALALFTLVGGAEGGAVPSGESKAERRVPADAYRTRGSSKNAAPGRRAR